MSCGRAYKVLLENNKVSLENVFSVSVMAMSLYYSRIIFHIRETMAKTDKERQAKRREKLKAHIEAYKAYLKKDKLKNTKQLNEKKNWTDQQKAAHKLKERNQVKTYRMNKAAAAEENCQDIQSTNISPY